MKVKCDLQQRCIAYSGCTITQKGKQHAAHAQFNFAAIYRAKTRAHQRHRLVAGHEFSFMTCDQPVKM